MDLKISYPTIKQKITPMTQRAKVDIGETISYYKNNAQYGWERGRKLAKLQHRNTVTTFAIKTASTIAHTKFRTKDVIPLISCALFSFTNPIPGMGVVGFALGKAFNGKISAGIKALTAMVSKIKLK